MERERKREGLYKEKGHHSFSSISSVSTNSILPNSSLMAPSAQYLPFLFLLVLFSSLQIQARESQFFNKFSRPSHDDNNAKDVTPGYGLYGYGSGQLPSTTTTTTNDNNNNNAHFTSQNLPNETPSQEYVGESYESKDFTMGYPNGNYYNKNNGYEKQGMADTRFLDRGYTTPTTNTNNNYYNKNNVYEQQGMADTRLLDRGYTTPTTNTNNNNDFYYNGKQIKKQGMSDTRFLENGKYYHHVNSENYYPNGYRNSRGVASRNQYDNRGYYNNNEDSYEFSNSMDGYQNQQEEYQQNQEEYVP